VDVLYIGETKGDPHESKGRVCLEVKNSDEGEFGMTVYFLSLKRNAKEHDV
jgi:hypothetical protein